MTLKHKRILTDDIHQPLITGFQEAFSQSQTSATTYKPLSDTSSQEIQLTQPAKKRLKTYIWVTWLSSLMGEDKQCKYTAWLSANYQFPKRESDFDSSAHDRMVKQRAIQHKNQGFAAYIEDDNSFTINGETCDIGGKPDIVVNENGQIIIEDCKSGKRKTSHRMQVLIYMLLFPLSPQGQQICQRQAPSGRLVYPNGIVEIAPSEVNTEFKEFFRQTVAIVSSTTPPCQSPSHWECRYCNVPSAYCPAKFDKEANTENHDLF
ncbi:hypothetical protein NIES2100_21880 [Calothrix sp. NIES-2100]|uniref:CRISPR-associated protein Cas4 n=1 Tax=Calothrix sp. NIES-2100 TaxID=1954172 RepID=UPI000B603C0E|nr:hypothetical protein NIES2100_21880 [Calothrix sp. NIES-2100]